MRIIRTYSELMDLNTFEDRFNYLKMDGAIGIETFGFDRYLNQALYKSKQWKSIRQQVILRDNCCDLGILGREIYGRIIIHHMNPITMDDILNRNLKIFDPEFLICTTIDTHNAIHYGDASGITKDPVQRVPNDTCPWR